MDQAGAPRKIRLRRVCFPKSETQSISSPPTIPDTDEITKNLQPLMQQTKKQIAQALYYEKNPEYQSPLLRDEKEPVHQRLGPQQQRLHRIHPIFSSNSNNYVLRSKMKLKRPGMNQTGINRKEVRTNFMKVRQGGAKNIAQRRMDQIRNQQRMKLQQQQGVVKLRRLSRPTLPGSANLKVIVPNDSSSLLTRFKMSLDPQIQICIQTIKKTTAHFAIQHPVLFTPESTNIYLSDRFTQLV